MSILIRDMEMPSTCSECDFCSGLTIPGCIYTCDCPAESMNGKDITRAIDEDCRHPDCPLVEVPVSLRHLAEIDETEEERRVSDE